MPQSSFLAGDGVGAAGWDGPGRDTELGNTRGEEQEGAGSREEA